MKITKLHDRTLLESKPNQSFLEAMKSEVKNPFSLMNLKSDIQIGMEFEFYIPIEEKTTNERIDNLNNKVNHLINNLCFFNSKLAVLSNGYEPDKDLNYAYLEKDSTLDSSYGEGFEFVSPMLDLNEVPFYIKTVSEAISDIGYSTNECGLHFHISSSKLKDIDMTKLMTFLHSNDGLLDGYIDRNSYVKSLERVFLNSNVENFNELIKEQTKQFDIVFLEKNHIELRVFGGEDIYQDTSNILKKLDTFLSLYRIASTPELEDTLYKELVKENLENGHHQLEPINLETLIKIAEKIKEETQSDLGLAFEEAFIEAEYTQIVPQYFVDDFNEKYELESARTI